MREVAMISGLGENELRSRLEGRMNTLLKNVIVNDSIITFDTVARKFEASPQTVVGRFFFHDEISQELYDLVGSLEFVKMKP
jgi:predicted nuclease with TOPRIM domain